MLLARNNQTYLNVAFESESEIEALILNNISLLFGDYSLLLSKSKLTTIGGAGSIPDGVLINFQQKEWYIIEVERGVHGTWSHIAPQVSKQLTAIINAESRAKILAQAIDTIGHSKELLDRLQEIGIEEIGIHGQLQAILDQSPILAMPIDETPDDLEEWASTLKIKLRIWIVEKYINDANEIIYSIPDFNQGTGAADSSNTFSPDNQSRQGSLMSSVVGSGLLKENDPVYLDYGPKGRPKKHFTGVIRKGGIEVEGKVYSPSVAALRCIKTVTPSRSSANGWAMWKTQNGTTIDEAYNKYIANKPMAT